MDTLSQICLEYDKLFFKDITPAVFCQQKLWSDFECASQKVQKSKVMKLMGLTETYVPSNAQKFPQTKTVSQNLYIVFLFFIHLSLMVRERPCIYRVYVILLQVV